MSFLYYKKTAGKKSEILLKMRKHIMYFQIYHATCIQDNYHLSFWFIHEKI